MSTYLEIRCGDCRLLLSLEAVEEVDLMRDGADASGRRAWRGQGLPVCNLVNLLGQAGDAREQVVVRQGEQRCIIEVSAVLGLRQVSNAEWRHFVGVAQETSRFFDVALPLSEGSSLLRLRQPLAFF